ncbi:MAG: right-handed parallel beta-helix repeat-containing protein [Dehalococcoidia bacterium]|nr:right-handed parallel beta-helix repeat-containing protein [Dehalococcoidia bacterium]
MSSGRSIALTSLVFLAALAVVAAIVSVGGRPAAAATFTVTKPADTADGACNADCSLREAIIAANAAADADTISLPAGPYTLTRAGTFENAAATGDLDITGDLTINGAGAAATIINGGGLDGVFHVKSGGVVSISGVTIQNGSGGEGGGGIVNETGTVTLTNSTVSGNTAGYAGGGIVNYGGSTLTLTNSTVSGNTANSSVYGGGGIVNYAGSTLTLTNSTVSGNTTDSGGGIFNDGTMTLTNSTVSGNTASRVGGGGGGGIFNGGTMTLTNSTVSGNTAASNGGGIVNYRGSTVTLTNSTVSGNTASASGGGIYNNDGALTLANSTITNNTADRNANGTGDGGGLRRYGGAVNLKNTIVAGNNDPSSDPDCFGALSSQGYNLIQTVSPGCTIGVTTGDITGQGAQLGPLALNPPGTTQTHAPLPGSPAIDRGGNCVATDQRGVARPIDGDGNGTTICDIGAYEVDAASPTPTATLSPTPIGSLGAIRLWGDFDCSGGITIGDAQKIARDLIDIPINQDPGCPAPGAEVTVDGTPRMWGDLDCQNGVTIGDAQKTARDLIDLAIAQAEGCPEPGDSVQVSG